MFKIIYEMWNDGTNVESCGFKITIIVINNKTFY